MAFLIFSVDGNNAVIGDATLMPGFSEVGSQVFGDPALTSGLFFISGTSVFGMMDIRGQNLSASTAVTASVARQIRKSLSASIVVTPVVAPVKSAQVTFLQSVNASVVVTGSISKNIGHGVFASTTLVGAIRKNTAKNILTSTAMAASIRKLVNIGPPRLAASTVVAPKLVKFAKKSVAASTSVTGTLTKFVRKILSAPASVIPLILGAADIEQVLTRGFNLGRLLRGRLGDIEPRPRLYVSNEFGDEIRLARTVRSASISLNNGRDNTFEMNLSMRATDDFDPVEEYLKPVIDYYNPLEQQYERFPLGLYRVMHPNIEALESSEFWEFTGASGEQLIAEQMAQNGFAVLPGTLILSEIKGILTIIFGVHDSMIDFPPAVEDVPLTGVRIFDIRQDTDGCYYLNIINTLLSAGGFTKLQTTAEGRFRVRKIADPRSRPPDVVYGVTGDNIIDARSAVKVERDSTQFANDVLVTSNDPLLPPIVARAINTNPSSPTSIDNLRRHVVKHIALPELVNATAAQAIADAELAKRSGINERLIFQTAPDPRVAYPSLIGEIELDYADFTPLITGRWLYEGWAFDMEPLSMMEHTLTKLSDI